MEPTGTVVGAEQGGLATDSGEDEVEDTPEVEDESEATAAPIATPVAMARPVPSSQLFWSYTSLAAS